MGMVSGSELHLPQMILEMLAPLDSGSREANRGWRSTHPELLSIKKKNIQEE
jgi:hypothetical protein